MNQLAPNDFLKILTEKFPFDLTLKQAIALEKMAHFVLDRKRDGIFVLKGFAGTGKTTIISTLVPSLWKANMSAVLMAPTGRAAKVMTSYSGNQAFTIHKKIYFPKKQSSGGVQFVLAPNKHRNTIFIMEASSTMKMVFLCL